MSNKDTPIGIRGKGFVSFAPSIIFNLQVFKYILKILAYGCLNIGSERQPMAIFLFRTISLLFLVLLFFPPSVCGESQAPIHKIAVLTDLSGPMAYQGHQTLLGAELAAEELNKNGKRVEVIIEDHQMQSKNALSLAQKLVELDEVDAVFNEFTPTAVAIAPLMKSKELLFVYAGGTMSVLTAYPQAFKTHADFAAGCKKLVEHWKARGLKKIGFLKPNVESAEICSRGIKEVAPEVIQIDFNRDDDVKTSILGFKKQGVEAIINLSYEPDLIRMFKDLSTIKYFPVLGALDNSLGAKTISEWPQMAQNMEVFAFPPLEPAFLERVRAKDPQGTLAAISSAAISYIHLKQMVAALEACHRADLACQTRKMEESGPDSTMGFSGWKDHVAQFELNIKKVGKT